MRRMLKRTLFLGVTLLAGSWLLAAGQSTPPAGYPDPTFGPSPIWDSIPGAPVTAPGIVTTPSFGKEIGAVAVQNIGGKERIVAVSTSRGAWKLARYRFTDDDRGIEADPTFGSSGVVTKTIKGLTLTAKHVLVQPDQKLLVVGSYSNQKQWGVLVVRYLLDGEYDTTFGEGGTLTVASYGSPTAPCLQPDGKILLSVYSDQIGWAVVRLEGEPGPNEGEQAGRLDESFGASGIAWIAPGNAGFIHAVAIQTVESVEGTSEDMVVVSLTLYTNPDPESFHQRASLLRLTANGTRDWTFAGSGAAEMDEAGAEGISFLRVAVDSLGRIVVGGSIDYRLDSSLVQHVLVARYVADGTLDPDFANNGVFTDASAAMSTQDFAVDPLNRILVSGWPWPHSRRGLGVWRLEESGAPDPAFGTGGLMRLGTMWAGLSEGSHVAFVAGGSKFLVGGSAYVPQSRKIVTPVAAVGRFVY